MMDSKVFKSLEDAKLYCEICDITPELVTIIFNTKEKREDVAFKTGYITGWKDGIHPTAEAKY